MSPVKLAVIFFLMIKSVQADNPQTVFLIVDNSQQRTLLNLSETRARFKDAIDCLKQALEPNGVKWTEKEMSGCKKDVVANTYFTNPQNARFKYIIFLNTKRNGDRIYFSPTLFLKDKLADVHYLPTGVLDFEADAITDMFKSWVSGIGNHILELVQRSNVKTNVYLSESLAPTLEPMGAQLAVVLADKLNNTDEIKRQYYISLLGQTQVLNHCNNSNCIVIVGTTKRNSIFLEIYNKPLLASPFEFASFPSSVMQLPAEVITKAQLALK